MATVSADPPRMLSDSCGRRVLLASSADQRTEKRDRTPALSVGHEPPDGTSCVWGASQTCMPR
jgi:hypothetical protein